MTKVISNADQIIRRLETSDEERLDILDKQIDENGEDVNQILEWTQHYVRIQTQHWTCLRCNEGPCTEEGHRKAYKAGTEPTGIPIRLNFEICNKGSCDATHAHAHQCGPGRRIRATLDLNQAIQWSWGSEAMQKQFDEQRAIQADAEADDEISSLDLGPPTNQAEIDYDDQYDDGTTIVEETERKKVIRTRQWLAKWCTLPRCEQAAQHMHKYYCPGSYEQDEMIRCVLWKCSSRRCNERVGQSHVHQQCPDHRMKTIPMTHLEKLPRQDQEAPMKKPDAVSTTVESSGESGN